MTDLVAIGIETLKIDSVYFLEKEFTELICINLFILYCESGSFMSRMCVII